jgi:hypothetical protein
MQFDVSVLDNTQRHLAHSSFLLKTSGIVMVFDYYLAPAETMAEDGPDAGLIRPENLAGEEV